MIDIQNETVVTFTDVTKNLKTRPHLSQVYRWAERGIGGVKLEYIQMGGKRCTSTEALQRFFAALTDKSAKRTKSPSSHSADSAKRELVAAGIEVGGGGIK